MISSSSILPSKHFSEEQIISAFSFFVSTFGKTVILKSQRSEISNEECIGALSEIHSIITEIAAAEDEMNNIIILNVMKEFVSFLCSKTGDDEYHSILNENKEFSHH